MSEGSIIREVFLLSRLEKDGAQKPAETLPELGEEPTSLPRKNIALREMLMKFQGTEKLGRRGFEVVPGLPAAGVRKEDLSQVGEVLVKWRDTSNMPCRAVAILA